MYKLIAVDRFVAFALTFLSLMLPGFSQERGSLQSGNGLTDWTYLPYNQANLWDNESKGLVTKAMTILQARIDSHEFSECLRLGSTVASYKQTMPASVERDIGIIQTFFVAKLGGPTINIIGADQDGGVGGRAYVDEVFHKPINWHYLETRDGKKPVITLYLGLFKKYSRDYGEGVSAEMLAGTILHELLHQAGFTHENGYNDGNTMTVAGDCISANGNLANVRTPVASTYASSSSGSSSLNLAGEPFPPHRQSQTALGSASTSSQPPYPECGN